MKKITFLILLIFCFNSILFSQWTLLENGGGISGIFFINKSTGFVGGGNNTICKTTDGGNSWVCTTVGLNSLYYNTTIKFLNNNTGFATVNYTYPSASAGLIYKTTNSGSNWSLVYTNYELLVDISCFNDVIYVSGMHSTFFKSTDMGNNWQQIDQSPGDTMSYVRLSFLNSTTGFAAGNFLEVYGGEQVLKTTNSGAFWVKLSPQLDNIMQIQFLNDTLGYVLKLYGIYRTLNGGLNWTLLFYPGSNIEFRDFKFLNQNIGWITQSGPGEKIFVTTNGGFNWSEQVNYPVGGYGCEYLYISDSICVSTAKYGRLYKTTNGGGLFPYVSGIVRYNDNNQPVTSGMVKAVKYDSLLNKVTVIDSAQIQSNGTYTIFGLPSIEIDFMAYEDDELDYVPTYYDTTIYWQHAITLTPTINLNNIDITVKRINNSGNGIRHIAGRITTGNDLGLSDAVVYAKIGSLFKNYAISGANGYFYIDSLQDGSYTLVVDRMGYLPASINVVLSGSSIDNLNIPLIFYTGLSNITGELPVDYSLSNYPNPFNPTTNILFDIIKTGNVKLTLYNLLGEELKVLVNEKLNAGKYKISFDGSRLASGVYFYKLETENFTGTKKMVLLK